MWFTRFEYFLKLCRLPVISKWLLPGFVMNSLLVMIELTFPIHSAHRSFHADCPSNHFLHFVKLIMARRCSAWKLSPILVVMPWMSWATSSCPEAMRAFSWLKRTRLSFRELSICSCPSYNFPCWACRVLWPCSSLSREAAVSSLNSSWPSCFKTNKFTQSDSDLTTNWAHEAKKAS